MSAELFLRLSHIAMFVGAIIAAFGVFGTSHFGGIVAQEKQQKQDTQLSHIQNQLDKIITSEVETTTAEKTNILQSAENAETKYENQLKARYELGYALLYVDGTKWYYIPREMKYKIDWLTTKIISTSDTAVYFQTPTIVDSRVNIVISGNTVSFPRKEGTTRTIIKSGSLRMVVECLEASGDTTIMAVGITEQSDEPTK
ncbi:MAG: hypothetical protein FVQ80_16160 [Planctomycetes bacterium]|nr:hypothetical protein [Planctomycetota bacterium]